MWVRLLGQSAGVCGALGYFLQGSRLVHDYALYVKYLFSSSEVCTPRLVDGYMCMVHHGNDVKHFHVKKEKEETKWSLSVRTTCSGKMPRGGESIDVLIFILIS